MKVNTYGIKMINLEEISKATVNNRYGFSQIDYDRSTGELLESWHAGNPDSNWTEYHDPNVIRVCCTRRHMSMQRLADSVRDALDELAMAEAQLSSEF